MEEEKWTKKEEMKDLRISVQLNEEGRIIGWTEAGEEAAAYLLPETERFRFSNCSGNCYRIEWDALVFDETLDIITTEQPKTDADIMLESLLDMDYRITLMEMGV